MTHLPSRSRLRFRKSSYSSGNGGCVEAAADGNRCYVADTKDPDGPMLVVAPHAWATFVTSLKRGHQA